MNRLVVALVTLIGLTGAAFIAGYLVLFSASTDRAATLAPANSGFYVNIYLQPSTGQQMNLSGLIGRLPGFADEASLDAKVDLVVQNLLSGSGIDYVSGVKPWLGNQVAIAGWPAGDDPSQTEVVVIAEVKDREAADAAVAEFLADGGASFSAENYAGVDLQVADGSAYGFVDDMLVIGTGADGLHAVVDASGDAASLADQAEFRATMDALAPDHLASAYIDLASIAESAGVGDQFGSFSTASAVLVAERDGLRVSGSAPFDIAAAAPSALDRFALGGEPSSLVDWMPPGTLAEVVVFGLRQTLVDAEAAIGASPGGQEFTSTLDTFRAIAAFTLGIDIDADVLPLLDREVAVAVTGLDGTLPSGQLLLRPDDPAAALAALDRIAERLSAVGGTSRTEDLDGTGVTVLTIPDIGEVTYAMVDDIIILGLGTEDVAAALFAHDSGDSLGGTDAYARTFEVAGTRAGTEAYVDIGALVEFMGDGVELTDDMRDILLQIGTFGLTVPSRDDQIEFHAVLTVDEP